MDNAGCLGSGFLSVSDIIRLPLGSDFLRLPALPVYPQVGISQSASETDV